MRAAYSSKEWITDEAGNFMGLSLGYDFCGQHERGVRELHERFGVNLPVYPVGVADRQITICPESLSFVEYNHVPRDKRRKRVKAASLIFRCYDYGRTIDHQERLRGLELEFRSELGEKWHTPSYDLCCAWSHEDFGINVRGDDNIEKLRQLYQAFQSLDLALCRPTVHGFLRQGLSFVICSKVPKEIHDAVNEADLAHQRLSTAVEESGIQAILEAAGLRVRVLNADWYDRDKEEGLMFYMNPVDERSYHYGWFTLDDLKLWAKGEGPVLRDHELDAFSKANVDWEIRLIEGLRREGKAIRHHAGLVWMDEAKTKVGIRIRPAASCKDILPEGIYPFDEWMRKFKAAEEAAAEPA